jgi:hypothetical protein
MVIKARFIPRLFRFRDSESMRAEIQARVDEIREALALIRRHL